MDKSTAAANAIKSINQAKIDSKLRPQMISAVCSYFDLMKGCQLSQADMSFMHYLANQAGLPQYFNPMLGVDPNYDEEFGLQGLYNYIRESNYVVGEGVMLHRYQKEVLDLFQVGQLNRFFLSAATSFGKTFLIYEILRKMEYNNVAFIFPTVSLLSENLFKIFNQTDYSWIKEGYTIHTLSDYTELKERNLFIFTPERYLSFLDKNGVIPLDFVFVDEVYKLDNGFIIDETPQENERDVAYRIALHELLRDDNTDALLVGPYIVFQNANGNSSSFKTFLDRYDFSSIDYNKYDIVNKEEICVNYAKHITIDDTHIEFPGTSKKERLLQLTKSLLRKEENIIIYCSRKSDTEKWAKELLDAENELHSIDNNRVNILADHIGNLFAEGKGVQWIVRKALKRGIGIHHGLVPKYIQQEIISLFNEGILKVLICTTTITEGVNTTAKNMIVLSGKKGKKDLKKFDALNIEGRAGRFMQHYKGRVFILDKEFSKSLHQNDEQIQHKLFDRNTSKIDVDIILTEPEFLNINQEQRKQELVQMKESNMMPKACFDEFKTISYADKLYLYNTIARFSDADRDKVNKVISSFRYHKLYIPGIELICQSIRNIIKNQSLRFLVENSGQQRSNCYLVDMISAFVSKGFSGSANYYIKKEQDVDKGIRKAAEFVFNTLRYQVVKYFGLFNMLYKQNEAKRTGAALEDISGIDSLLLRLEYNADTLLGRRASDIGASFNVIQYFDIKDSYHDNQEKIDQFYNSLDDFEKYNVAKINTILD